MEEETKKTTEKTEKAEAAEEKKPPSFSSVKNVGIFSDRNAKYRRFMEDAHVIEDKFNGSDSQGFFAVYDGHGGKTAAIFCQENFHKLLGEELSKLSEEDRDNDAKIEEVFRTTYQRTDDAMKATIPSAGACSVTCLIKKKRDSSKFVYCANAGDSRAVLCRDGKAISLTIDHKATNQEEADRIVAAGGFIKNERINGLIAVSRALGDHCMKMFIISEPHFTTTELLPGDSFLILACDGVWDILSEQTAVDLVIKDTDPLIMAKKLLVHAIKGGSTDNITVMVILL